MDTTVLEEIGLKKDEIGVYLALLKLGSVTATQLAKETNILRTNIYWIIESLIHRGFVSYVIKNNVKYFTAAPPTKILDQEEEKKKKLQELIPELEKLTRYKREDFKVEVFRGKEGLKAAYRQILKEKKDCKVFGEQSVIVSDVLLPEFLNQLLRDFEIYGIKEQLITKEWRRGKAVVGKTTDVRYIPDDFPLPEAYIVISGDLVITFDVKEPYYAILIKSKEKAELNSRYFDRLWRMAKD